MDLSKLYYKGHVLGSAKGKAEESFNKWTEESKAAIGQNAAYQFTNIQMAEMPAYYFQFDFQKVERKYSESERAYNGESDFPSSPMSLKDLSFESYPIENISVGENIERPEEEDTTYRLSNTLRLLNCPKCKGKGVCDCSKCNGTGRIKCPKCKNSGRTGYIRERDRSIGPSGAEVGKASSYNWVQCPRCTYSPYGVGVVPCDADNCKNGIAPCSRCKKTGKVIKYVSRKDHYFSLPSSNVIHWHDSIPENLKAVIKSNNPANYADSEILSDTEEQFETISKEFAEKELSAVNERYDDLLESIREEHDCENLSEDNKELLSTKVTKTRVRVYKITIVHVSYEYDGANYELWLYGKDNDIFNETNPFLIAADKCKREAEEFLDKKKPAHAIAGFEKACRIAEASKNYSALNDYGEKLNKARKKSNGNFWFGIFGGLALSAAFYLFALKPLGLALPTSLEFLAKKFASLQGNAAAITAKIIDILLLLFVPLTLSIALLFHIVRDKIKNKVVRVLAAFIIPLLYAAAMTFLPAKISAFVSSTFVITNAALLLLSIVILIVIKIPYKKISSQFDDVKVASDAEADGDSDGGDSENESYSSDDEISAKHRGVALALSIFFGIIGVHRFYVGKIWTGLLQCAGFFVASYFTSGVEGQPQSAKPVLGGIIAGVVALWVLADIILICAGKFKDKKGARIKKW